MQAGKKIAAAGWRLVQHPRGGPRDVQRLAAGLWRGPAQCMLRWMSVRRMLGHLWGGRAQHSKSQLLAGRRAAAAAVPARGGHCREWALRQPGGCAGRAGQQAGQRAGRRACLGGGGPGRRDRHHARPVPPQHRAPHRGHRCARPLWPALVAKVMLHGFGDGIRHW